MAVYFESGKSDARQSRILSRRRLADGVIVTIDKFTSETSMGKDGKLDPGGKGLARWQKAERRSRPANVTAFIQQVLPHARIVKGKYRVPVSIVIAQAALESGWGRYVKGNAYFGIKAHGTVGATTTFGTTEFVGGKRISISDSFRAYTSFREAAEDYGKFLTSNPRYSSAFAYTKDPFKFAEQLGIAKYATDPRYVDKLKAIISTYNLDEYDK